VPGEIIAITAAITFPLSNVLFKKVDEYVTPAEINAIRTTIGAITFLGIIIFLQSWKLLTEVNLEIVVLLLLSIIFGQIIGDTAYFKSQKSLGTIIALTISSTFPFFTFIIAIMIGREIPPIFHISGLTIGLGIFLISKSKLPENKEIMQFDSQNLNGIIMGLLASLTWAIAIVLTDISFNSLHDNLSDASQGLFIGNAIRFPFASIILLVLAYKLSNNQNRVSKGTYPYWIQNRNVTVIILAASILGTSLGVLLYSEAVRQAGAPLTSLILTASPLFSIPIAWIINREKVNILELMGMFFTAIGLILIL
jgi:drug/metabolite transporter (DMT)-like permease